MPRRPRITSPDRDAARAILAEMWNAVLQNDSLKAPADISGLVNSDQTAIRFCLPTQLLGKLTDNELDALCLQRGDGTSGKWDPRGFASTVVVPWNQENQGVLGPSGDPYVSNPLRRPRVDSGLDQMSDRDQWENLLKVLEPVQSRSDASHTREVLELTLVAIRDRMRDLTFVYIVPERVSLLQAESLVEKFLSEKSGGDRGLAVAAALFETIRERLNLFKELRRSVINAADAATKAAGDLECIGHDGQLLLAVEVKERRIGDADVHLSLAKARGVAVRELIFCCDGIVQSEQAQVEQSFSAAWASGTNLYQVTIKELMRGILPLMGEMGIRTFIIQIGRQLDEFSTQPRHRKAWKTLLDNL